MHFRVAVYGQLVEITVAKLLVALFVEKRIDTAVGCKSDFYHVVFKHVVFCGKFSFYLCLFERCDGISLYIRFVPLVAFLDVLFSVKSRRIYRAQFFVFRQKGYEFVTHLCHL